MKLYNWLDNKIQHVVDETTFVLLQRGWSKAEVRYWLCFLWAAAALIGALRYASIGWLLWYMFVGTMIIGGAIRHFHTNGRIDNDAAFAAYIRAGHSGYHGACKGLAQGTFAANAILSNWEHLPAALVFIAWVYLWGTPPNPPSRKKKEVSQLVSQEA